MHHLADDYELGKRIADLGLAVKLSDVVVETYLPAYRLKDFFAHQLRWARGVRDARAGRLLRSGIHVWNSMGIVGNSGKWNKVVVLGACWFRTLSSFRSGRLVGEEVLRDHQVLKNCWLIPLRDLIGVGVWIVSLGGHTVTWRGDRFSLKNGELTRIESRCD